MRKKQNKTKARKDRKNGENMFAIFKQNEIDINTHTQHIYDY